MNPRRRRKNRNPSQPGLRRRPPSPNGAQRQQADQAAGSAWLFADFLAAMMTLPPDQLSDLE